MAERILVVEDETTLGHNIARYLARAGYGVTTVACGKDAFAQVESVTFDVVITDLRLPDVDGLEVLDHVRQTSPDTAVLVMTAYASVESAVDALRRGAHDYVLKPLSLADLLRKVEYIVQHRRLGRENARLRTLLRGESGALELLRRGGHAMNELCDAIEKVALSSSNVIVLGESGTGKELVARAIHERSARAEGAFVAVDVSAIAEPLVESVLFGQEANAFLGADASEGLFRAASGGTLFLDEIGELPLGVQVKLLRAVETKEILPVGADRPITVDTRIIAATHRDLASMVREGTFREDLRYRLQVVELRVPPLRERMEDVPTLARGFVERHAKAQRKPVRAIAADAVERLLGYTWPGNVRELSNVIERAVILCSGDTITTADLPASLSPRAASGETPVVDPGLGLEDATLAFQRTHIARVLDRTRGNREAAAKLLGLSAATFYRYLQRVGLKGYRADVEEDHV